jgi:hypothetical protein
MDTNKECFHSVYAYLSAARNMADAEEHWRALAIADILAVEALLVL